MSAGLMGFCVGIVVGAWLGVLTAAMMVVAKGRDDDYRN